MKSLLIGIVSIFVFTNSAFAALPPGWEKVSIDTDWLGPGNNQQDACNGIARSKFGDRPFEVVGTSESQKFRVPELRIDAQYQYHCQVLVGPK